MGKKGKGIMKRKKTFFQKGHPDVRKKVQVKDKSVDVIEQAEVSWKPRLTKDDFQRVVTSRDDGSLNTVDADNRPGNVKLLRPMGTAATSLSETYLETGKNDKAEMRLLNKRKYIYMWNHSIQLHSHQSTDCRVPEFEVDREIKKGICWRQGLKCLKCGYKSDMYKLYEEINTSGRGAKTAAPNVGLQVGLQESTCGNHKMRVILAATNTPPPCRSSMQHTANTVGTLTATLTSDSLKQRRKDCKKINRMRGLSETAPINIGIDARYNSNSITGRSKQGQNASQAIGLAIEHQTDERKIVALDVRNQLCSSGKRLNRADTAMICPGRHPGCTSNTGINETLSEYKIGEEIGHMFARDGILIRHVTTDGDARSAEGVTAAIALADPSCQVIRQADTTHLGQAQFRHCLKLSKDMFPAYYAMDRGKQMKNFALDVKSRCMTVYNHLHGHYKGDMAEINKKLPKAVEGILDCYAGNCSKCRRNYTACSGGKHQSWWARSVYLSTSGIHKIKMLSDDRKNLKAIIEMKLSEESTALQKLNFNTNKNEAMNRGLSASLPKNVKFSRNVLGRASAAVHRLNHGLGDSVLRKLEAVGSPVSKGGHVAKAIRGFQNEGNYQRAYKCRKDVLRKNSIHRAQAIRQYFQARRDKLKAGKNVAGRRAVYRKGQIDPKPRIRKPLIKKKCITNKKSPLKITVSDMTPTPEDHSYSKSRTVINYSDQPHTVNINVIVSDHTGDHSYCKN